MADPLIGGQRLVTADHVCQAVQATLVTGLPTWLAAPEMRTLRPVATWLQVPTVDAVQSAVTPVGAITSTGLAAAPERRGRGQWDATWRVIAAIYDRGSDYGDTQFRARAWSALVRTVLANNQSLGGLAETVTLIDEGYDGESAVSAARTLGLAMVEVEVLVRDVVPTRGPITLASPPVPTAISTSTSVTVHPLS